jgi:putative transposase
MYDTQISGRDESRCYTCMNTIGPRKNLRLPEYDYHNGWFFITNKTYLWKPVLVGDVQKMVKRELYNVTINEEVTLDYATIVPNHVHVILALDDSLLSLSEVWRRFKARTTVIARKNGLEMPRLWQPNFYEHIIRNERALENIRKYIQNNPLKERLPLNEIYGVQYNHGT